MPPCRTTLEIRGASMPDSRATMARASSDVWRCWLSKSAGTYSASITGVIGITLRRRTMPLQVCDSVAAVAIAPFARSVSARSIGTRMDLNIGASMSVSEPSTKTRLKNMAWRRGSAAGGLLQHLRADEQHELAVTERHVGPVVDRKIEYRKPRGRQVARERLAAGGVAAAGQRQRQFMHARIVPDQQQPLRIGGGHRTDGVQQLRRIGAVEFRQQFNLRRRNQALHRLP